MSGLCCARDLSEAGLYVTVIDKGRGLGGRLANRRIGEATFDHGAQYFTARDPRFQQWAADWETQGLVQEWYRSVPGQSGGSIRWRGNPSMTALAKNLGASLPIQLQTEASEVHQEDNGWRVQLSGEDSRRCRILVLTAPVPQALALLEAGEIALDPTIQGDLEAIVYDPCIAVMAVLDGPSGLPREGAFRPENGPIQWIADNHMKGISALPALTLHASSDFSRTHWERDRSRAGELLIEALPSALRSKVVDFQVHGWKFSQPINPHPDACVVAHKDPLLVLAGDAFQGPRVEGAACSGWAAAAAILDSIKD